MPKPRQPTIGPTEMRKIVWHRARKCCGQCGASVEWDEYLLDRIDRRKLPKVKNLQALCGECFDVREGKVEARRKRAC